MSESANEEGWASWWKTKTEGWSEQVNQVVSNLPSNEEMKAKLEEWGTKAGDYLDEADRRIEEFENSAVHSLKAVQTDIKHYVEEGISLESPEAEAAQMSQPGGVLFTSDRIATSRLEAQIHRLHQSPSVFMKGEPVSGDIESRTDTIAEYLETYPELRELFEALVPEKVEYKQFWLRYFAAREQIEEQDRQRKALLARQAEEEIEDWGSSEDDAAEDTTAESESEPKPTKLNTPQEPSKSDLSGPSGPTESSRASSLTGMKPQDVGDSDSDWE